MPGSQVTVVDDKTETLRFCDTDREESPRRMRAKYTHRTNHRFVLWIFRPAGLGQSCRKEVIRVKRHSFVRMESLP